MELALYSNDPELHTLCRDIVRLSPGLTCVTKEDFKTPSASAGTVCIFDSSLGSLRDIPKGRRNILIVDRSDLEYIRNQALHLSSVVLLKPLTRAQLEIVIEQNIRDAEDPADQDPLPTLSRDALLECLLNTNLQLQEFDQNRTHFLIRATHELRAPLTSLIGYCELFLDGKLGQLSSEQHAVISRILRSINRLNRIVSTMFDMAVGQPGDSRTQHQLEHLLTCVEQAVHEIAPVLRNRNIDLQLDLLPAAGPLCFDPLKIEQVFVNLLENSARYVPRGGVIRICGYPWFWERRRLSAHELSLPAERRRPADRVSGLNGPEPNAYRVDITDNGPGILPSQIDRLFEEFTVHGGASDRSGAGLGLAICRMITDQHNGKIWAESPKSGGATFCVVTPYCEEESIQNAQKNIQSAGLIEKSQLSDCNARTKVV
jgi:signal transduction histidine kinase